MQPILTDSDRLEKMDLLLRSLFREPDARVPVREFGRTAKGIDPSEIEWLKAQLIQDGAILLREGPTGPEIIITEAGIDFFISGGYSREWSQWEGIAKAARRNSPARMGLIWGILILGLVVLFYFLLRS